METENNKGCLYVIGVILMIGSILSSVIAFLSGEFKDKSGNVTKFEDGLIVCGIVFLVGCFLFFFHKIKK